MPGFQEAVGRVIGRGNFFENSGFTGPDLWEIARRYAEGMGKWDLFVPGNAN